MRKSRKTGANPARVEIQALVNGKAAGSPAVLEIVRLLHNLIEI